LDAGHAAQNVLLTCEQLNINAVPIAGFCDDNLANDLRLDGVEEAVIHCISLGKT
jgi:nitroreductase